MRPNTLKYFGAPSISEASPDSWLCTCGNEPTMEGFFPCDETGRPVEPTYKEWTTGWYVCDSCGRIIDQETLHVVGHRVDNDLSLAERKTIILAEWRQKAA